ncbi:MAG TPA: TIGR02147 family protein [Bdellovibrio sp.]|nr:TIGR02147 family protein [Bdellovibrio sp.]
MNIFEFEDYRLLISSLVENLPKNGRGEYQKIARALRMHTTYLSQVLKGLKNLNQDQALDFAEYWKFNPLESRYFLLLVDYERAGSTKLKNYIRSQLFQIKEESKRLISRLNIEKVLEEKHQTVFYSSWLYSAVRLASSLDGLQSRAQLGAYFQLDHEDLEKIISFLVTHHLCEQQGEKIVMGAQRTHVSADSPMVSKHHTNWRLKAIDNYTRMKKEDMSFTGPLSISEKDAELVKEKLTQLIREVSELVKNTEAEKLYCLNLDWFHF